VNIGKSFARPDALPARRVQALRQGMAAALICRPFNGNEEDEI
jgi:hypothetical protein